VELSGTAPESSKPFALFHRYVVFITCFLYLPYAYLSI
jgi:hypothetical protein